MQLPPGYLERIDRAYFSAPERRCRVTAGTRLLGQGEPNDRLYRVISGAFSGSTGSAEADEAGDAKADIEIFQVSRGGFIGVHSFFSASGLASVNVTALTDSELAWIDRSCAAVDEAEHGSLIRQFFSIVLHEMDRRQMTLLRTAKERESYLKRLHLAEDMAVLGQFAAGLAHELNNSIGVLRSSSVHLGELLRGIVGRFRPALLPWFERGMSASSSLSSAEVRALARSLERRAGLDYERAKDVVRMTDGADIDTLPENLDEVMEAWETGRSCRDMLYAAGHAAGIIQSIKQLSGGGHAPREEISVSESLREALALLKNAASGGRGFARAPGLDLRLEGIDALPRLHGNKSELVQIWTNVMKNALEAMADAATPEPRLEIVCSHDRRELRVDIANNGPPIPEAMRKTIFQPNITTKRHAGHSMGLGLGLYIVKRLVESYGGDIVLSSGPERTGFSIRLPLQDPA